MITLGILMTLMMVLILIVNVALVIYNIAKGNVWYSIWFALGVYLSYTVIGNFAIATVEFINRGM